MKYYTVIGRISKLNTRNKKIKLLLSDFDGVMTDNTVYVDENGMETVRVSRADGQGVSMLKRQGIEVIIVSTEKNPVVAQRAKKLGIESIQGISDKKIVVQGICKEKGIELDEVAYVGNDVNDYGAMSISGIKIVPADAYTEVKDIADIITKTKGGAGVIREIATILTNAEYQVC